MTDLNISDQENDQPYEINRIHFPESGVAGLPSPGSGSTGGGLQAHRQRLEQLLESARHIEELLAHEAAQARALSENLKLDEKHAVAAQAAEKERQASAEAQAYAQNSETTVAFQVKLDAELAAARAELSSAEASVRELRARLGDAQNLVVLSNAKVIETESRSKEAAKRADLAKALMRDADIRVAKCREAREAAQAEVSQAQEIANSITLTAQTLERIRNIGSSGLH